MNKIFVVLIFCLSVIITHATDLRISNPVLYNEGLGNERVMYVIADLQWNNVWSNVKNYDAAWLFVKMQTPGGYRHVLVSDKGAQVLKNHGLKPQKFSFVTPTDRVGLYLRVDESFRGNVNVRIKIQLDPASLGNFNPNAGTVLVNGLEMVFIPEGNHYVGEADTVMLKRYHSLYSPSAGTGSRYNFLLVDSENEIAVKNEPGALYYTSETPTYQGDQQGPIPASFPKGFKGFFLMKYELTQGQYAAFLNTISNEQSQMRANFGGKEYYRNRGSISFANGQYVAAFPARHCNYLSWDDAMAFADWAGLRPYTELEFNKACLGNAKPKPNQYPWGTSSRSLLERAVDVNGDLVLMHDVNESQLSDTSLETFGASYYWVMDLAGSVWERTITVGDPKGRAFVGSHGDGTIDAYGFATNEDWPKWLKDGAGFGFRGGGFYTHGRPYGEFLPHSPVSYRRFAAWSGGNRVEAYGSRFARSAEK